jgi:hypothetical protein
VLENRVLRKIFGPTWDEMIGGWIELHNEELHNLLSSSDIVRMIKSRRVRWVGDEARIVVKRNAYRVLVGKPEGKKQLGRHRRRREDNIKIDLKDKFAFTLER